MAARVLLHLIIALLIVYFLFALYLYFFQRKLIYYPDNQDFNSCPDFDDYEKVNYKGTRFYYLEQSKQVVIYYHGNAGSACGRSFLRPLLEPTGKSIIIVEYAGYSNDERGPSKELILKDVEHVNRWIKEKKFTNVTTMGMSIGASAASYHAQIGRVDQVLLLAPFSTTAALAQSIYRIYPAKLLLKENYDNIEYLSTYQKKLLIIHGKNDRIISPRLSRALFDSAPTKEKQYILVEGAGHNTLFDISTAKESIRSFIERG